MTEGVKCEGCKKTGRVLRRLDLGKKPMLCDTCHNRRVREEIAAREAALRKLGKG
jgi:hypothetical protein